MKKFLKLALAVAALTTMFGFASCSNDSSNDSTTNSGAGTGTGTAETAKTITELKYTDAELAGKIFTYKDGGDTKYCLFYNGGCFTVDDKSKFNNIGSLQGNSPSILKFNDKIYKYAKYTRKSGEGLYTTWENDSGTMSFTATGNGSFTYKGTPIAFTFTNDKGNLTLTAPAMGDTKAYYDGTNIYVLNQELTFVENYTPAATNNVFKGKTFASPESKIFFIFGADGKVIFAQEKEKIFTEAYTVTGNDFTFTVAGINKISGSLSGTTLTAGDATHSSGTFTQIVGTNGFGGKSFITADGTKLVVVVSDSLLVMLEQNSDVKKKNYTVQDGKVIGDNLEATLSGKTLTVKVTKGGVHTDILTLIE